MEGGVRDRHRRQLRGRVGVGQRPADSATVADLRVGEQRERVSTTRSGAHAHEVGVDLGGARWVTVAPMRCPCVVGSTVPSDAMRPMSTRWPGGEAQREEGHKALTAGEHLRLLAERGEEPEGVRERLGAVVRERQGGLHRAASGTRGGHRRRRSQSAPSRPRPTGPSRPQDRGERAPGAHLPPSRILGLMRGTAAASASMFDVAPRWLPGGTCIRGRWRMALLGTAIVATGLAVVPGGPTTAGAAPSDPPIIGHLDEDAFTEAVAAPGRPEPTLAPASATPGTLFAGFNPVTTDRVLDRVRATRASPAWTALGPDSSIDVQVTGSTGVPGERAGAVVLNVTVTGPTAGGFLTVWPTGSTRPNTSSLNMGPGQTVPNAVVVKLGAGGKISVYNNAGSSDVLVDVVGWAHTDGHFVGVTPATCSTPGPAPVGAGATLDVAVTGVGGVPESGVATVVLNITATPAHDNSYLTVWPAGATQPNASNLNMTEGQTVPNLVYASVGAGGKVSILDDAAPRTCSPTSWGTSPPARPTSPSTRSASWTRGRGSARTGCPTPADDPNRLLKPSGRIGQQQAVNLDVNAALNDRYLRLTPSTVQALVFNVTALDATATKFVTLYPRARPDRTRRTSTSARRRSSPTRCW